MQAPGTASIPVMVLTADAMPKRRDQLLAAGAASYITKPINVAELLEVIDEVIKRAQQRGGNR